MSDEFSACIMTTTGHRIRIAGGWSWQEVAPDEDGKPKPPIKIHAIHVLSTEDTVPLRFKKRHEFRAGFDYSIQSLAIIIQWLRHVEEERRQGDYEFVDEFLEEFAEFMAQPTDDFQASGKLKGKRRTDPTEQPPAGN